VLHCQTGMLNCKAALLTIASWPIVATIRNRFTLPITVNEGGWIDAGTFESLWRATKIVREKVLLAEEQRLASASAR